MALNVALEAGFSVTPERLTLSRLQARLLRGSVSGDAEVIAWLSRQSWCNGRVGMMGKSWGGFNALQTAALRPPALQAIITVCSTDDRYADDIHYMGGALLNDNLWWGAIMLAYQARPADPDRSKLIHLDDRAPEQRIRERTRAGAGRGDTCDFVEWKVIALDQLPKCARRGCNRVVRFDSDDVNATVVEDNRVGSRTTNVDSYDHSRVPAPVRPI